MVFPTKRSFIFSSRVTEQPGTPPEEEDKKHGEGTFRWADGRQYAGQWQARAGESEFSSPRRTPVVLIGGFSYISHGCLTILILFNRRSVRKPAVFLGFLEVV